MNSFLVLFPNDWDTREFRGEKFSQKGKFDFFGNDLFKLPGSLRLPFLNTHGLLKGIVKKARAGDYTGVISTDEYIGAILAAAAARELGLPGTDPARIILAQHKYYSRLAQQRALPESSVQCDLISPEEKQYAGRLRYPFFIKPVKGTFSLFARKVNNESELRDFLNFNYLERFLFRRLTRPFNQLLRTYTNLQEDADYFLAEELMQGDQVTVDGFAFNGKVVIQGIVDSVMFPGTSIFERFEYPSRLPRQVRENMVHTARRLIEELDYRHGQFNIEFFYHRETNSLKIIEINPRMSYQFADLYENVDGTSSYDVLLHLALGQEPVFRHRAGPFKFAASFVLRTFKGRRLTAIPHEAQVRNYNKKYPESRIKIYGRKGTRFNTEMRAIGSYRYGIVNVGAHSMLDLFAIYEDALSSLTFEFR